MAAMVDELKVIWDSVSRAYWCAGQGFAFNAWFAGTPAEVEAELFDPKDSTRLLGLLYCPAPGFPAVVPSEYEVASSFSAQLRRMVKAGFPPDYPA